MMFFKQHKKILVPTLLAFVIASFYIIVSPGEIASDAWEYDRLSDSILIGEYSIDGEPSMLREPGYPTFRAILKSFGANTLSILWIQALLYAATVFFIGMVSSKIDPRAGL